MTQASSVTRRVFVGVAAGGWLGIRAGRSSGFQVLPNPPPHKSLPYGDGGGSPRTDEATKWESQRSRAEAPVNFWNTFFDFRQGASNATVLDAAAKARLLCIVRAVSWVESKHGTAGANQPERDPMQCGNPADSFWMEINDSRNPGSRYVGGPNAGNLNANELPAAMETASGFPRPHKLSVLGNRTNGHNDTEFNAVMSYMWGTIYLAHRINTHPDLGAQARLYKCGDLGRERLIKGAVAYNGGGDSMYRQKIEDALSLIGCLT